ncbi:hypothetical protein [Arcobacter porcinus]|uniref:Putative membrane protein n=1 Tax=Arcobacter porcinus TaxID=1935204 RepID=A0A5C2HH79_9BACT|nr:hypothetical protein [Arcobacter porcinus]OCL89416.1 hypothetical protein AAX27_01947 [Aliarcobacter thereius]QEP40442.1 putative membrane protein [Arcobacter porcinus]
MNKNYLRIYIFTIIPASILFFLNFEGTRDSALFLLFCGMFMTFLEWKQDDGRVKIFIDKFF